LSLAFHPIRRAPYADILDDVHFHHVSPAYAKRFQRADENEEQYVERLRQELEDKFLQLGSDTVVGCMMFPSNLAITYMHFTVVAETVVGATTGVVPAPKGYFKGNSFRPILSSIRSRLEHLVLSAMKSVCDKYGALFILDEVRPMSIFLIYI